MGPMKSRVTVRFGDVRVIVPCNEETRVRELVEAAVMRFGRVTNKTVSVRFLQSISTGGILDGDDRLCDVFDFSDQIVAIFDETTASPLTTTTTKKTIGESNKTSQLLNGNKNKSNSFQNSVEIFNLTNPPPRGLRVAEPEVTFNLRQAERRSPMLNSPSALGDKQAFDRNSARKSRITDAFLDASERVIVNQPMEADENGNVIRFENMPGDIPHGLKVIAVFESTGGNRLRGVKITAIDGRLRDDSRIAIGDVIVAINGRPVYQMSIGRVNEYLNEMETRTEFSLTLEAPKKGGDVMNSASSSLEAPKKAADVMNSASSSLEATKKAADVMNSASSSTLSRLRPVFSALQQANTTQIGNTQLVSLKKEEASLGFTIASRETAKNERLFYIKTVTIGGAADGILRSGDRLLEVNGEVVSGLSHEAALDRLRRVGRGEGVDLLVSRLDQLPTEASSSSLSPVPRPLAVEKNGLAISSSSLSPVPRPLAVEKNGLVIEEVVSSTQNTQTLLDLDIALNDTGSAGLGVSVKGRTVQKADGSRVECGIFIKKVLNGGAASKDGRLQINDRLLVIEQVDLTAFPSNAAAMRAITDTLSHVASTAQSVQLTVARTIAASQLPQTPTSDATIDDGDSILLLSRLGGSQRCVNKNGNADYAMINKLAKEHGPELGDLHRAEYEILGEVEEEGEPAMDPFIRETRARRSISEKRHLGAGNDAAHTLTFQKIQHSRQHSAPTLDNSNTVSIDQSSTSPRRGRPIPKPCSPPSNLPLSFTTTDQGSKRRAVSLECNRASTVITSDNNNATMIHEMAAARTSSRISKVKAKARSHLPGNLGISSHDDRVIPLPTVDVTPMEKQNRRKSLGSGFFSKNWFRLGATRSREVSPEKAMKNEETHGESKEDKARRCAAEERCRIQEQYEMLRQKEANRGISAPIRISSHRRRAPPPPIETDSAGFPLPSVPYEMSSILSSPMETDGQMLRVANSRFYRSLDRCGHIAPYRPTTAIQPFSAINSIDIRPVIECSNPVPFSTLTHSPPPPPFHPVPVSNRPITVEHSTPGLPIPVDNINLHRCNGRPRSATIGSYLSPPVNISHPVPAAPIDHFGRPRLPMAVVFPNSRFILPPQRTRPPLYSELYGKNSMLRDNSPAFC